MSSRDRRASLPGVDELFRSTARPAERPRQDDEDASDEGPARQEPGADDIVTPMRRPERPEAPASGEPHIADPPAARAEDRALADERAEGQAPEPRSELEEAAELAGHLVAPRGVGDELSPAIGAVVGWAAATVAARQVVEVDVRSPALGRWMVSGMPSGGTVTLIGGESAATLDSVRTALVEDDPSLRVRTIPGDPAGVLERLSDGSYDLVVVRAASVADRTARGHVVRLLRAGGILLVVELTGDGHGTDVVREFGDDPRLRGFIVPAGGGALVASRT